LVLRGFHEEAGSAESGDSDDVVSRMLCKKSRLRRLLAFGPRTMTG